MYNIVDVTVQHIYFQFLQTAIVLLLRNALFSIIIWSRDTRLTILVIFYGCISQDNLSVARDSNNLSVLILNILRIPDVIIYNLMTLHSYHNMCGNIWKITGQFTQVFHLESLSMNIQQLLLSIDLKTSLHNWPSNNEVASIYYNSNNLGFLSGLCLK